MYWSLIVLLCMALSACSPRYADFFPYYDNGTKKPSFVLLPVYNETANPLVENFPEDLTKAVRNRLKRVGKTYSPPVAQMQKALGNVTVKELVSDKDLKMFKRFQGTDFVVLMETIECQVVPYKRGTITPIYLANIDHENAKVMKLAIRMEIVDLKGKEPKLARIEIVKSNHMISDEMLQTAERGNDEALEIVRSRLARDLARKIEETVCVKK